MKIGPLLIIAAIGVGVWMLDELHHRGYLALPTSAAPAKTAPTVYEGIPEFAPVEKILTTDGEHILFVICWKNLVFMTTGPHGAVIQVQHAHGRPLECGK